jgi:hypothetical protein
LISRVTPELLLLLFQGWTERAKRIQCLAPLPEEPVTPRLAKMLVPAPYKAPEKKAKKTAKGAKGGTRRKGTPDGSSEDEENLSTTAGGDDNEEETREEHNPPPEEGKRKRAASSRLEVGAPKKGKGSVAANATWDIDSSPERHPRTKPRAEL